MGPTFSGPAMQHLESRRLDALAPHADEESSIGLVGSEPSLSALGKFLLESVAL
jgi:hypothetical protein